MKLFRRKKEVEKLDLLGVKDVGREVWKADQKSYQSPGLAVVDLVDDDRLPEAAREAAAKIALQEVYWDRRNAAVEERTDLQLRHQEELEMLYERQRRELDQTDNMIEGLRQRFKMTPS